MAQIIKQPSIFGRLGTGIGKGLGEQIPKEIERNRLASGLKSLGEQKNLDPYQRFAGLAGVAHEYPQILQSGERILNQQARGQALANYQSKENQPKPSPFENIPQNQKNPASNRASITQEKPLEQIQEGFIPPTKEQEFEEAGQLYNENPARFGNDPEKAIDFVENQTVRNQAINQAYEKKHENLNKIQDNVVKRLKDQSERLNTRIPSELYTRIEDEAIQATKSKKEGGQGLTEQQAIKEYGDKMNSASRDFEKINEIGGIGGWGVTTRPPNATLSSIKNLQNSMDKLGETDNFAKLLQSRHKYSPKFSYALAQPVSKIPELNSFVKKLPELKKIETIAESKSNPKIAIPKTLQIAPQLAKFVKEHENASPLGIAYELDKKGYDGDSWLKYLADHPELNLRQRQNEQSSTPINPIIPWNDWWLSSFSGIE